MKAIDLERARRGRPVENMAPLYMALATAQGAFPEIPKTKEGHGYRYADIADILKAVRPVLAENGLCLFQNIEGDQLVTTLAHASGATLSTTYPLVTDGTGRMNNIQRVGAALTYARRYSLTALLGVAPDEDLDAKDVEVGKEGSANTMGEALRDAWKQGVLDSLPENATDADRATAFANQIMQDMQSAKNSAGVNRVWQKREDIIEALDKKHNALYQDVFDCFHTQIAKHQEAA